MAHSAGSKRAWGSNECSSCSSRCMSRRAGGGTDLLRLGDRVRLRLRSWVRCFCWLWRPSMLRLLPPPPLAPLAAAAAAAPAAVAASPRSQGCCSIWPAVARLPGTKLSIGSRKSAKLRACSTAEARLGGRRAYTGCQGGSPHGRSMQLLSRWAAGMQRWTGGSENCSLFEITTV